MIRTFLFALLLVSAAEKTFSQSYIFYLHGAIVEMQGPKAHSPEYGDYEYDNILAALRKEGFTVISECRKQNTDGKEYAHKVVGQIDSLIKTGVKPGNITVIGASKGSFIAMHVSTYLKNPKVNFVFMGCCNDDIYAGNPEITFCGNILSIYEKSDNIGQSCQKFKQKSSAQIPHYKEIMLNTGLKHGYLYKPMPEWVAPAVKWAKGEL